MISMEIQWSLVIFTTLAGAGAWGYAAFCVGALKGDVKQDRTRVLMSVITLVMLVVGGLASVTHLSHPDRIMAVLAHPTVGIFAEALFVGLVAIAVLAYLLAARRGAGQGVQKALLGVGAVLCVLLSIMLGYSYMMAARPAWNTILLPIAYMLTATSGGTALFLAVAALGKEDGAALSLGAKLMMGAAALVALSALAYGAVSGTLTADAALFWLVVVLCGAVVPAVVGYCVLKRPVQALTLGLAALAFALIGCAAFRCLMWTVGAGVCNFFGLSI